MAYKQKGWGTGSESRVTRTKHLPTVSSSKDTTISKEEFEVGVNKKTGYLSAPKGSANTYIYGGTRVKPAVNEWMRGGMFTNRQRGQEGWRMDAEEETVRPLREQLGLQDTELSELPSGQYVDPDKNRGGKQRSAAASQRIADRNYVKQLRKTRQDQNALRAAERSANPDRALRKLERQNRRSKRQGDRQARRAERQARRRARRANR